MRMDAKWKGHNVLGIFSLLLQIHHLLFLLVWSLHRHQRSHCTGFLPSDFIILLTFPPFIPLAQDVKLWYWTVFVASPVATCLSQYLYNQLSSDYFMSSASAVSLGTLTAEDVIVWDVLNLRSWRVTLRKVSKRRDEERSNWWLPFGKQ